MKILLLALQASVNVLFVGNSALMGVLTYAENHGTVFSVGGVGVDVPPFWILALLYLGSSAELWGLWNRKRVMGWIRRKLQR